jgi:hypothetical protein
MSHLIQMGYNDFENPHGGSFHFINEKYQSPLNGALVAFGAGVHPGGMPGGGV